MEILMSKSSSTSA